MPAWLHGLGNPINPVVRQGSCARNESIDLNEISRSHPSPQPEGAHGVTRLAYASLRLTPRQRHASINLCHSCDADPADDLLIYLAWLIRSKTPHAFAFILLTAVDSLSSDQALGLAQQSPWHPLRSRLRMGPRMEMLLPKSPSRTRER